MVVGECRFLVVDCRYEVMLGEVGGLQTVSLGLIGLIGLRACRAYRD